jgi:predicted ATPase/class 3 adenylate cyclase/DNA-binding SARP family transcriptional activator
MNEPWTIQLFGGLRVRQPDRVVTRFRTQKTGALLAYLAYHRGQSHSREILIEVFWPDTAPESGRHNLSHALSSLRSLLEPPGIVAGSVIIADRFSVELNPDAFSTDVAEFDRALRNATQARNSPDQAVLLVQALEKYSGPLLPEYYEDWIVPAQERLVQRFRQVASQAISLLEKAGDPTRALEVAQRVISLDPESDDPDSALKQAALRLEDQLLQTLPALPTLPAHRAPQALPTGTVTVLMTDIEGSTALWEKAGDAFRSALSTHHALLRGEFRRHGGQEVKEAGDSFLVVFSAVGDALACAIACQRGLDKQPWPKQVGKLAVRMALHTGDVELEDGEYHGLMLHRAARMLAAAHGGQIICSDATTGLLIRDLEPQVRLKDLGVWRLRDVELPERLFQAVYSEMEIAEFPTLNAAPSHRAHLPLQFTRFFGRDNEISRTVEILSLPETRLLTLSGPGGTGKTRLSIEAAAHFSDSFDGAIWFVPLADLSDPALIPQAILQAMGVPLSGNRELMEQVNTALSNRSTLLLLDNFEQLVAGGAEIVQALLNSAGGLKCMVTSRQTLSLPGEVEFAVAPLSTPNGSDSPERLGLFESVRLFVDRAQAAKPDFRITNQNAPALAELCDRLEGIPLAIELAAARALVLSPSQMLAQLGNRFEFLVSRKRGVAERQRTLRAAVDWSYKLLAPDLQRFFAQLCVFRGGWTLEAAEAVCDEPLALDMLAQLRECSLVSTEESEGSVRFRVLESLREYAEKQLSEGEQAGVAARHACYFMALAEEGEPQLRGKDQAVWLNRFEAEHDNLRAALAWSSGTRGDSEVGLRLAGSLYRYWKTRGHWREGTLWYAGLLGGSQPDKRTLATAKAQNGAAHLAYIQAEYSTAQALSEESLAICLDLGERREAAVALCNLGGLAMDRGEYSAARNYFQESRVIRKEIGDKRGLSDSLFTLGLAAYYQGDLSAADSLYDESQTICQEIKDRLGTGMLVVCQGLVACARGDFERALALGGEGLAICRDIGERRYTAIALFVQGHAMYGLCDYMAAQAHYLESLRVVVDIGWPGTEPFEGIASVLAVVGDQVAAARLWGASEQLREGYGCLLEPVGIARYERQVADARTALGDDAKFDRAWQEGRAMTLEQAVAYALEETAK